jgi:hypothetical protein
MQIRFGDPTMTSYDGDPALGDPKVHAPHSVLCEAHFAYGGQPLPASVVEGEEADESLRAGEKTFPNAHYDQRWTLN